MLEYLRGIHPSRSFVLNSHILIVDDDEVAREAIRSLLDFQPYHLQTASSGRAAIELALAEPPDVILLDVMMPEMDGYEVVRQIRGLPAIAEVPVLMLTALDDQQSYLQGLEAGADDFLTKPINRHELRARVGTILRLNRYRRLLQERARSHELAQKLIYVQEEERRRVAVELHDEVGQSLTILSIQLSFLVNELTGAQPETRARAADMIQLVNQTVDQLHHLGDGLRPPALDTVGLAPTLQGYCRDFSRRTQIPVLFACDRPVPPLPDEHNITLYRILQEALSNVVRHAAASQVWVRLRVEEQRVGLAVRDDGRGYAQPWSGELTGFVARADGSKGLGLQGILERAALLGGQVELESQPGQGSRITAWITRPPA